MKKLVYIVFCFIIFGCQDVKRPEKPENLIPEDVMVELLTEVYLGNAIRSIDNKTVRKKGVKIDSFLYKKFNVDSLQFAKSNAYYASDLNRYNAIFQKIQQKLETLKTEENNRKLRLDSIKIEKRKAKDTTKSKNNDGLKSFDEAIDTTKTEGALIDSVSSEQ